MPQPELTYKMSAEDLKKAIRDELKEQVEEKVYNRFYSILVDCKTTATILNISQSSVTRYINDGILTPEPGTKKFRLSSILKTDLSTIYRKRK